HKKHISRGHTVFLDAGHGGSDPGASGNGLKEKDLTLDITNRVKKLLEDNGFIVKMSRTSDKTTKIEERTNAANKSGADSLVSIHIYSEDENRIERQNTSNAPIPKESIFFALCLLDEMTIETKERDRGVKVGNFHVNRASEMPSSLVEMGFIDT